MEGGGQSGFLPPQAPGPEPDLGDGGNDPTQPLPPTGQTQAYPPPQQHQYGQPYVQPYAQPQPQPWQAPYGYGPPPGYGYAPPPPQQPYPGWAPPPREPDNNQAVAGFSLSVTGGGLLFVSAGFSSILSLGLSIAGMILSRQGVAKVDRGETHKQRGLAQAGYVTGIISTVLSLLATAFWILFFVLAATNDDFQRDLQNGHSGTIAIALLRGVLSLL